MKKVLFTLVTAISMAIVAHATPTVTVVSASSLNPNYAVFGIQVSNNSAGDGVWIGVKISPNPGLNPVNVNVPLSYQNSMTSGNFTMSVPVSPAKNYYRLYWKIGSNAMDSIGINPIIVKSTVTSFTMTPIIHGCRFKTICSDGYDVNAVVSIYITALFDSTFQYKALLTSTTFSGTNYTRTDSVTSYPNGFNFRAMAVVNNGCSSDTVKIMANSLPAPAAPELSKLPTSVTHTTSTVSFTHDLYTHGVVTSVNVNWGTDLTYANTPTTQTVPGSSVAHPINSFFGLLKDTRYYFNVCATNAYGTSCADTFSVLTDAERYLYANSVTGSDTQTPITLSGTYKTKNYSSTNANAYMSKDSSFSSTYKSANAMLTGGNNGTITATFTPPFAVGTYYLRFSYTDMSDNSYIKSNILRIEIRQSTVGIEEVSKSLDFSGQYQIFDMSGKEVGGGIVKEGDVTLFKLRELALPPGIYVYRIRSDKNPQMTLSGKIGRL